MKKLVVIVAVLLATMFLFASCGNDEDLNNADNGGGTSDNKSNDGDGGISEDDENSEGNGNPEGDGDSDSDDNGDSEDGGKIEDDKNDENEDIVEHTHVFDESFTYDEEHHYHVCSCSERCDVEVHILISGEAIDPTCYSVGYSAVEYCETCGFIKACGTEINKLPHTYSEGICTVCEFPEPSEGLSFELSEDKNYYILTGVGTCKDDVIVIPEENEGLAVKEIAPNAFELCVSIREIVIPNSINVIGDYAFYGCEMLTNITLGGNVKRIGFGVFYDTAYHTNQSNWENGVLYLDHALIEVKSSDVTQVNVKEGVSVIADYAFSKSADLVSVNISGDVSYIGKYAFMWCDSLTDIVVTEGKWRATSSNNDVVVSITDSTSAIKSFVETYYYCNWCIEK